MKQNSNLKSFILAAAASLGLAASALAQTATETPAASDAAFGGGLLGTRYTAVEGNYYDLRGGSPSVARGFTVAYNQPLSANFDLNADYSWAQAHWGARMTQQQANIGATALTNLAWGKPFVAASAGWVWARSTSGGATGEDDSFAYKVGTGVEFQVSSSVTVTPFVNFARVTSFDQNEYQYGVKAAYRFTREWSATARVQYDAIESSDDTIEYALGFVYQF